MPVLSEAFSVIIKDSSIQSRFIGGLNRFMTNLPNNTHCTDQQIHRIGFMSPADTGAYINFLTQNGLVFMLDGKFVDIGVVEMILGPTAPSDWLGFARQTFFDHMTEFKNHLEEFSLCWLIDPSYPGGVALDENMHFLVEVPEKWSPDKALYTRDYIPAEEINDRLIELGQNKGLTYYWDVQREDISYAGKSDIPESDYSQSN
jgi:hypothetical protein